MKVVYRYPLEKAPRSHVKLPSGAQVLEFGYQNGEFSLWALVDPDRPYVDRVFQIVGTGDKEILPDRMFTYVGTAAVPDPQSPVGAPVHNLVFHCFEIQVIPQAHGPV